MNFINFVVLTILLKATRKIKKLNNLYNYKMKLNLKITPLLDHKKYKTK